MTDRTIRDYVRRRLAETPRATLETIWRDARDAFPYRAPGWGYICKLKREFDRETSDNRASPGD